MLIEPYAYKYPDYNNFCTGSSFSDEDYVLLSGIIQNDSISEEEKNTIISRYIENTKGAENIISNLAQNVDLPYSKNKQYGIFDIALIDKDNKVLLNFIKLFFELHGTKRTRFCREAERIVTTKAFRHLQYKTQVMINSASDDQRTRLLHSLEVQGIARTLAMQLGANWELVQAIALGHDVGHVPFGHAGEKELDKCLEENFCGGFSHAMQSVKVLSELETHPLMRKYGLPGIGLSKHVLEGILKHDTDLFLQNITQSSYQLQYDFSYLLSDKEMDAGHVTLSGMESQIVYWADKIAYLGHDWDEFANGPLLGDVLGCLNSLLDHMVFISKNKTVENDETILIMAIIKAIDSLNEIYQNGKEKDLLPHLRNLLCLEDNIPENLRFFTKDDYLMLFRYFRAGLAWITITHKIPRKYKNSNDILYILYSYFQDTKTRRIVPRMQDELLLKTSDNIIKFKDELKSEEDFISVTNNIWRKGHDEVEELIHSKKNEKLFRDMPIHEQEKEIKGMFKTKFQSSMLVSVGNDILDAMRDIDIFIFYYYINSTLVKNMTTKAGMIIKELFKYYMLHPEMLPPEYKQKRHMQERKINDPVLLDYCKNKLRMGKDDSGWLCIEKSINDCLCENGNSRSVIDKKTRFNSFLSYRRHVALARTVADFIGDMTDRMAVKKYDEITSSETRWSTTYSE